MLLAKRTDGKVLNLSQAQTFEPFDDNVFEVPCLKVYYAGSHAFIIKDFSYHTLTGRNGEDVTLEVEWYTESEYRQYIPAPNW